MDTLDLRLGPTRLAARFAFDSEVLYVALWSSEKLTSCALAIDADNDGEPSFRQTGIQLAESEQGWQLELAIPFSAIGDAAHRPPQAGDRITVTISSDVATETSASARLEFAARTPP
jgi:hypothetical protein